MPIGFGTMRFALELWMNLKEGVFVLFAPLRANSVVLWTLLKKRLNEEESEYFVSRNFTCENCRVELLLMREFVFVKRFG